MPPACVPLPHSEAAERPWHSVPGDRDTSIELLLHLGMDLRTVVDASLDPLGWRHGRELDGVDAEHVSPEQDALAQALGIPCWVGNLPDRQS